MGDLAKGLEVVLGRVLDLIDEGFHAHGIARSEGAEIDLTKMLYGVR